MGSDFQRAMWLMRRHDAQTREDGFDLMSAVAAGHVPDLIHEFGIETDHGLRCWLLELLGRTRDLRAIDLFVEQLHGEDEQFVRWAVRGLRSIDTKAARTALYRAQANGLLPPVPD